VRDIVHRTHWKSRYRGAWSVETWPCHRFNCVKSQHPLCCYQHPAIPRFTKLNG